MTVQLDSGLMYQSKKNATINMIIGGKTTAAFNNAAQPTPFPDLDPIYGMQLPVYDISQSMIASEQAFCSNLDYIGTNASTVKSQTMWFGILSGICFVLGTIAVVVLCLSENKKDRNDLLRPHQAEIDQD